MQGIRLIILIVGTAALLAVTAFCGYKVHKLSAEQESIKESYSIVNSITFGLLSVNEWRDRIVSIVGQRVQHFQLTKEQEEDLEKEIEQVLYSLIDKTFVLIEKPQKTLSGKLKKLAVNTIVNKNEVREQVPAFSKKIIAEIQKPSSKKRLTNLAQSELQQLGQATYDSSVVAERSVLDSIFNAYHVSDADAFDKQTAASLSALRQAGYAYAAGMFACILAFLALWWLLRNRPELHAALYIMSILSAVVLLWVGLTTTMIEIDARIKTLDFHLIGETISFKNQVLFFQSKSIADVVNILVRTRRYDAVIVGILILCFSILFPIAKLLSAGIYILGRKEWTKNKLIAFFAFQSGKWSMADVMVVAILMAYIGFNGIIENQLSGLNIHKETLTSITTNHTSLQPGYIVFIGFVLYGLILSTILKKITHHN